MNELALYNRDKSEVMSRAAELREEGYDPSTALSQAWAEVQGEDYEDNPLELIEVADNPKPRRTSRTEYKPSPFASLLMIAGVGTVIWRLVKKQWPWETWQQQQMVKRAIAEAERIATQQRNSPEIILSHSVETITPGQEPVQIILP